MGTNRTIESYTPLYRSLKFKDSEELDAWLKKTATNVIDLQDNGQDLMRIWRDDRGEILHVDAQTSVWTGKFIDMDYLAVNGPVIMWMEPNWRETDFIVESINS